MNKERKYIKQLEQVIKTFLEPMKGIPFPVAIKALTGYKVLCFNPSAGQNKIFLEKLCRAARSACLKANKNGIFTARPNEAGNLQKIQRLQEMRFIY